MNRVIRYGNSKFLLITRVPEMSVGRFFECADINGVPEDMCWMNCKMNRYRTITTILIRHRVGVITCHI